MLYTSKRFCGKRWENTKTESNTMEIRTTNWNKLAVLRIDLLTMASLTLHSRLLVGRLLAELEMHRVKHYFQSHRRWHVLLFQALILVPSVQLLNCILNSVRYSGTHSHHQMWASDQFLVFVSQFIGWIIYIYNYEKISIVCMETMRRIVADFFFNNPRLV